ncbi:unnamed protein product [Adineta ricciae]|uniref:Tetratricopeptide repeat protein n=1 Tax=Adineta ricciae TaxID=249248 RepID=A0A816H539_ADIRI|nr:unnamed protein product [Adineta ricciae]
MLFDLGEKCLNEDTEKSLEYFLKSLNCQEKNSKVNHLLVGICHQNIGGIFVKKHLYDKALDHYLKSISIYEKHLKNEKKEEEMNIKLLYGKCHCEIARIYQKENYYDKSTEYFLKTIQFMEDNFPLDKLCFLADCYEGIGLNFYRKSQYDLSIEYYSKCLDFLLKHLKVAKGCDHQKEIVSCLIDLSCVYIDKKDYTIALRNLEKISQILPLNHKDYPNSFLFIGLCYMEQKQYEIAVKHFHTAIQHYEKHLPSNKEICSSSVERYFCLK